MPIDLPGRILMALSATIDHILTVIAPAVILAFIVCPTDTDLPIGMIPMVVSVSGVDSRAKLFK